MPSRRSHTKSRRGCLHCKRRHVKCDEGIPRCSLCKKRGLECGYPPSGEDGQFPLTPQASSDTPSAPDGWTEQTRLLEMKLFHHYVIDASFTLRQDVLEAGHFQVAVPRLATSNPFLLDIILAFSALHQAFLEQGDSKWLEIALKYQNRACSAFSRALADLAPENLGPAFICSIFIMLCAFAYPCVSQNRDTFDPVSQVLEINRLLAGCAFLFQQLDSVEQPEEVKAWMVYKRPEVFMRSGPIEDAQDNSTLEWLQQNLLKSLEHLRKTIDSTEGPHQTLYQNTWDTLQEMVREWPRGKNQGGILAFPIHISGEFMIRLKEGDWTARMIFLHYGGRSRIENGKRGAAASESAICSRHGTDIIMMGGNAADAMVATMLCVGVVGMYHSGIGGGGFMLVKSPEGAFEYIDFRESAPAAAYEEMFNNNTEAAVSGGLASGVPGELRGLEYLHEKYGSLPWSVVVQPAIRTARDGFPVGADLVRYMESAIGDGEDFLVNDPSWAIDFAPHGTRVKLGDTITRKRYADTLEAIATHGPDALYSGPIAETMIKALQAANGTMTLEDLQNYTVIVRDAAQIDYRGYRITSSTAPSSGTVTLNILKVLDTYEPLFATRNVNLSTHRMDEAIRFGYGLRTVLGDPDFVDGMTEYEDGMLNKQTIDDIRGKISDLRTQNVSAYDPDGFESLETPGTSHIATTDHSGLAVSAITTINLLFGSKVMVPETGIIMNNEMDDFSIPGSSNSFGYVPSEANFIRPGKRPLSSCTPAIVTHPNGTTFFVAGSAGGSRIITATVQNIIHAIDEGLSAAEALAKPRLHDQLIPNRVAFEYAYDNETVAFMESRGHNVTWMAPGTSTAQAIRVLPNGTFDAAGEPRQFDSGGFAV
ncbi:nucleophile aminohydrolase [Aspergillus cavernicola]|uniref:Glutathione hydrolase n=1 Tax=Aspergillus cavernicola TaxID=176166 RepID=A0ABR4I5X5_9EURO